MSTVAERMRLARENAGLKQSELSERSGVSSSYLCQAEQGDAPEGAKGVIREPSVEKLRVIAAALGVRFEWLALGTGEMTDDADEKGAA